MSDKIITMTRDAVEDLRGGQEARDARLVEAVEQQVLTRAVDKLFPLIRDLEERVGKLTVDAQHMREIFELMERTPGSKFHRVAARRALAMTKDAFWRKR